MSEYPVEKPGLDGTGLTEAKCLKHGKVRTVSADALFVKGAPLGTFAMKCLEPLTPAAKSKHKNATGASGPVRTGEASANGTNLSSGAPHDAELCQEYLVPLEAYDDGGNQVRKGGKLVVKDAGKNESPTSGETGGEKLVRATSKKAVKKSKNTAAKRTTRVDSRGGKGVSVKDED